ncbi:MAG: phosphatidate cytidylyltransferase [Candidatus Latescibacteria bacterium]|nr:phosphatidate cytidylyltransferase [Candidatus Latescibacterota bacterium]
MTVPHVWVRILVGLTLIPVVLLLAWVGGVPFVGFIDLVIVAGLWEFYRMAAAKGLDPNRPLGLLGAVALSWSAWFDGGRMATGVITGVVLLAVTLEIITKRPSSALLNAASTVLGVLYVGWLSSHLILLRELPRTQPTLTDHDGMGALLVAFLIPWGCDTAAYFTGRGLGRHRLIPRVSTGKTVEGALGGLAGALVGLFALRSSFFPFLSRADCWVLGLAGGLVAQVGDLAESLMKRDSQVKDSSHLIPGHGGVLDRFDSVLFCAPLVYYYLRMVVL